MLQETAIKFSLLLQPQSNGGIFQHLDNINGLLKTLFTSWLLNVYCIILPVFVILSIFLLVQTIFNWRYLFFPKLRFVIPLVLVMFIVSGVFVFIQLHEINNDIISLEETTDNYSSDIIKQILIATKNAKSSLINTLKIKRSQLFPIVENLLRESIYSVNKTANFYQNITANSRDPLFQINILSKSKVFSDIFKESMKFSNNTLEKENTSEQMKMRCDKRWVMESIWCKAHSIECQQFTDDMALALKNTMESEGDYRLFFGVITQILPAIKSAAKIMNWDDYISSPDHIYKAALSDLDIKIDSIIDETLGAMFHSKLEETRPVIHKQLNDIKFYLHLVVYALIILNIAFFTVVFLTLVFNHYNRKSVDINNEFLKPVPKILETQLEVKPKKKFRYRLYKGAWHISIFIPTAIITLAFVATTSILLNSQTELCRYLGDINNSAPIADKYIDKFLSVQSNILLEQKLPEKLKNIPHLNIRNPQSILTTMLRHCPAKKILLPSLSMSSPINSTALIFSDYLNNEIIQPNLKKIDVTLDMNYQKIYNATEVFHEVKNVLVILRKAIPSIQNISLFLYEPDFKKFIHHVNNPKSNEEVLDRNYSDADKYTKRFVVNRLKFERKEFDYCFEEIYLWQAANKNRKIFVEISEKLKNFRYLLESLADLFVKISDVLKQDTLSFTKQVLRDLIPPAKIYSNEFLRILERETLANIIPCKELGDFYLKSIDVMCTHQIGNILVLAFFGMICFTLGCLIILFIMMAY